jgi:hypothetical protein
VVDTITDAMSRLQAEGYHEEFSAIEGGRLRCSVCGTVVDAAGLHIDLIVRYEGESDPADEEILYALSGPGDHRGLYVAAYGADATPEDIEVATQLPSG